MNNFTIETQGLDTFRVYEITEKTELDTVGLGMLLNNKIEGLCPLSSIQMDNRNFIRYNISSQISLKQFFMNRVSKKNFLTLLINVLNTIENIEDYMLEPGLLLLEKENIYVNVSTLKTDLIYYLILDEQKDFDVSKFVKNIIIDTEFDLNEKDNYITLLINFLNANEQITIAELREYIISLLNNTVTADVVTNIQTNPAPAMQNMQMPYRPIAQPIVPPVMPPVTPPVMSPVTPPVTPPVAPVSMNQNLPSGQFGGKPVSMNKKTDSAADDNDNKKKKGILDIFKTGNGTAKTEKTPKAKKTKIEKNNTSDALPFEMTIPGAASNEMPQLFKPASTQKKQNDSVPQPTAQPQQFMPSQPVMPQPQQFMPSQPVMPQGQPQQFMPSQPVMPQGQPQQFMPSQPVMPQGQSQQFVPSQPVMPQGQPQQFMPSQPVMPQSQPQQFMPSQPVMPQGQSQQLMSSQPVMQGQPQVQSAAASNNYGETMVLGASAAGETTVLSAGHNTLQKQRNPYLLRKKTNENIQINKDIFRIGKESSYVDYCITDNTAISRSHADIIKKGEEFYIVDNNSLNHTFLNNIQIQSGKMSKLEDFMLVKLADEVFEFRL